MSYARTDDDHVKGQLSDFRTELYVQVRLLSGCKDFTIFQDKFSISPGQNWQKRVYEEVDSACVFIAIMTPAFFQSEACREEVERFHKRVSGSQNPYLLLPIYYVASLQLEDPTRRDKDSIAALLYSCQYDDWRELRKKSINSQAAKDRIDKLAQMINTVIAEATNPLQEEHGLVGKSLVGGEAVATLQEIAAELEVSSFRPDDPTILAAKTIKIRELLSRTILAHPTRPSEVTQALDALRQVLESIATVTARRDEITSGCDQAERLRKLLVSILLDR